MYIKYPLEKGRLARLERPLDLRTSLLNNTEVKEDNMPIPKQQPGEHDEAFVSRCIGELSSEYEQDQAAAICYQQTDIKLMMSKEWRKELTMSADSKLKQLLKKTL